MNIITFPKVSKVAYENICEEKVNKIVVPIELTNNEGFIETYLMEIYSLNTINISEIQCMYNSGIHSLKEFITVLHGMGYSIRLIEYPIFILHE